MTQTPSWFSWLSFPYYAPLSGAVTQDLSTRQYRGIPAIEADVIQNAGSFGSQLGILSDAVIQIANRLAENDPAFASQPKTPDETASAVEKLRRLTAQIEEIKSRHKDVVKGEAEDAMKRLQRVDPKEYEKLLRQLER